MSNAVHIGIAALLLFAVFRLFVWLYPDVKWNSRSAYAGVVGGVLGGTAIGMVFAQPIPIADATISLVAHFAIAILLYFAALRIVGRLLPDQMNNGVDQAGSV